MSYPVSGLLSKKLGAKLGMIVCLCIAALGSILILFAASEDESSVFFYFCLMMCMFGSAGTWNVSMCALAHIFPVSFIASAFGAIIFITQLVNILTPYMAALTEPTPMIILVATLLGTAAVTTLLKPVHENKSQIVDKH